MSIDEACFIAKIRKYIGQNQKNIGNLLKIEETVGIIPKSVKLPNVNCSLANKSYRKLLVSIVHKYPTLYERFASYPHIRELLIRYDTYDLLSNISLSVPPELKRQMGIDFELFGAFYNTNYPYCTLFPDLERDGVSNAFYFKPTPNQIVLANPPYTYQHIKWTINKILHEWKNIAFFWVVIPVWDTASRVKHNLPLTYSDFPEITTLLNDDNCAFATIQNLNFYNGIDNKMINLHDQVHIILIGPKVGIPPIPNINEFIFPANHQRTPANSSELPANSSELPANPQRTPALFLVFLNPNLKNTMKSRSHKRNRSRKRNRNY